MPEQAQARRWLLLLGSSRDDAGTMHAALRQLAANGSARWLTAVQRFPADDRSGLMFYNALATWQPAGGEEPQAAIRRIEAALGRDRSRRDEVAIDIDLLACGTGTAWRAYPHAVDKGEFERPLVRDLLQQAGVAIVHGG